MKKFLVTLGAAALGGAILASGIALAGDKDKDKDRDNGKQRLATGFTFCDKENVAVFPATNIGHRPVTVSVSCVDNAGGEFGTLPDGFPAPKRTKLEPGDALILFDVCLDASGLGGDLVRCTVKGADRALAQVRGVLHICQEIGDVGVGNCGLTEALLFGSSGDDDD